MTTETYTRPEPEPFDATRPAAHPETPRQPGPVPSRRRRRRPAVLALAAGVAVTVIVAGVAGVTLAMQRPPSAAAYASKADAVCTKTNGRASGIPTASTYPQLTSSAGTLAGTTNEQLTSLRTLERPSGAAGVQVVALLDAMDAGARAADSLANTAAPTNDFDTVNHTNVLQSSFADARDRAGALGMSACAVGLQPGVDAVAGGSRAVVKAAFVAKADALCRGAARQLESARPVNESRAEFSRFIQRGLEVFTKLWRDIEVLPVPPGDERQVQELRDANQKQVQTLRELRDALAGSDMSRVVAAAEANDVATTTADAKLDAYGLQVCGSNFGSR